jgi:putative ATPase
MTEQGGLFEEQTSAAGAQPMPLAARMRPVTLDEVVGQEHLTGPGSAFRRMVESDGMGSVIFWGPPGVGKTTLAEVIARQTESHFARVSATTSGVADLRKAVEEARLRLRSGRRTTLFIDEIHRFNKAQQDAILPHVENGTVTLIGATTENPSFEVNAALLSRSRVYVLRPLEDEHIRAVIGRALANQERGLGKRGVRLSPEAESWMVNLANGDARSALNMLEMSASLVEDGAVVDVETVADAVQRRTPIYDKAGESHFDQISALHKSVRGSDADATLYWLARMLESGEDPLYLARRLVRMAVEDIGLADPKALEIAMAAQQAVHFLGVPEGALALAQCAVYLALSPKSNRLYLAYGEAVRDVEETRNDPVPIHLRNAPTGLMKDLGYGKGYRYAHDHEDAVVAQQNLPDALKDRRYFQPSDRGFEQKLRERIEELRRKWKEQSPG